MSDYDWMSMVPAYVLDALDPEEREAFEARLEVDAELRAAVRAERELVAEMAGAVPALTPPPGLRDRILDQARGTPTGTRSDVGAGADTGRGGGAAAREPAPPSPAPAPVTPLPARPSSLPWMAAAAAVLVALAIGVFAQRSVQQRAFLESELTATRDALDDARGQLAERDSLLSTFLGPDVRSVALSATDQPPSARLFWNRQTTAVLVAAFNLPPAPDGRVYQLWGIADGANPVSLGTFQTEADGTALVQRAAPGGADFQIGAVTEEPQGGSPQPTSAPFLVGSWTDG